MKTYKILLIFPTHTQIDCYFDSCDFSPFQIIDQVLDYYKNEYNKIHLIMSEEK